MTNPPSYTKLKFFVATLLLVFVILVTRPWDLYFLNDDFIHIPLSTQTIWVHFTFFRPIANMVTAAEVWLYGNNPLGFHITSLVLHIMVTFSVMALTRALLKKYSSPIKYEHAPFLIGCLFFIYPFHSEPLLWVIGRIAMIATLFYVLSLIFFIRATAWYHYALSIVFFIPALFTYEISWTLPLLITILAITDRYLYKKNWRATVGSFAPHWIVFGLFVTIRSLLLNQVFTRYEVEGRSMDILTLAGNYFRLIARTIAPPAQSTTLFITGFAVLAAGFTILVVYCIKKKAFTTLPILLTCLLLITYLPVITFGIDTHGTEGERYLYLPSVCWLILLVLLIYATPPKFKTGLLAFLFITAATTLAIEARYYQHASRVAKNIITTINPPSPIKNIIALNLPANYKGAMIYRMGYPEAVRWMRPEIQFQDAIIEPAARTFDKVSDTLRTLVPSQLPATGLSFQQTGPDSLLIDYNNKKIQYSPKTDLLLYFPTGQPGVLIYPHP
ncbi:MULTISPECIES: glucosyltransferase domain-containing protein [Niastella]|uniref:Glycosyltransferase RgtA/B/C/D-like domain-containing protein n=1 Tax=Niastella soli TaxID=2821487 RepID=A0ABS3YZG1_9BACT|nr:glucosyltransferase domain-containing protein [Niastella soli]MBO9203295.1 hypothetical protein [Niastella soli]